MISRTSNAHKFLETNHLGPADVPPSLLAGVDVPDIFRHYDLSFHFLRHSDYTEANLHLVVRLDSKEDAEKMKDMVDLQWSLIVVASLAGAADPPELLDDDGDDGSDYGAIEVDPYDDSNVQQWLEGLGPTASPSERPDLEPSKDTTAG